MPKLTYLFVFLYISPLLQAQSQTAYQAPLDLPLYLSGNFGELRSDHFHSGIDIKTQGRTGHPVRAISDGQVSRIKVQASGYGKSIYIAHPDGKTSVYGHLDSYRDDIAAYVRDMQYKQQSQEVDLYPEAGRFPIMQGEQIALSGNSGSSGGPHLHFEIRQTANQNPTNVLSYGFPIADHLAPRFRSLHVIPCSGDGDTEVETGMRSFSLVSEGNNFSPGQGRQIPASGCVTLGVEVFDYLDGSSNRCGIHTLDLYVDDELSFHYAMDEFSFAETRYINAHLLYPEKSNPANWCTDFTGCPATVWLYGKMIDQGKIRVPVGETRRIGWWPGTWPETRAG
ncbi:MAG: M23 family metallopeptidase [Bacteroidales bacterium]